MATRCSICKSEKAEAVDASLRLGWTRREVGLKFGFSSSTVGRHARKQRRKLVIAYFDEVKEQVAELARESMEKEIMPELCRLTRETHPNATLARALANIGLGSPGQRMLAVDALVKALVRDEAWGPAGALLVCYGHDPDEARAVVETVAESEGGDPLLARLELMWARPPARETP